MTTHPTLTVTNGIAVDRLVGLIRSVHAEPKRARFVHAVANRWLGGTRSRASVGPFTGDGEEQQHERVFHLDIDQPGVLLGRDEGVTPVEQLLAALSGCLTATLVTHAASRGVRLSSVEATYEGDLDIGGYLGSNDEVRSGLNGVRVMIDVRGDAKDDELDELVALATKHSPVFDVMTKGVPIEVERGRRGSSRSVA